MNVKVRSGTMPSVRMRTSRVWHGHAAGANGDLSKWHCAVGTYVTHVLVTACTFAVLHSSRGQSWKSVLNSASRYRRLLNCFRTSPLDGVKELERVVHQDRQVAPTPAYLEIKYRTPRPGASLHLQPYACWSVTSPKRKHLRHTSTSSIQVTRLLNST